MPRDLRVLGGPEDAEHIAAVLAASRELLLAEPSLLRVDGAERGPGADAPPLRIVGDVHGQFGDLLRILFDLKREAAVTAPPPTRAGPPAVDATAPVPDDRADPSVAAARGDEGLPPTARYLFLGDYVNRGRNGIECMVLLLCLKLLFPRHVLLLRGNHECASITRIYGFYDEVKRRFHIKLWKRFADVFNCLPLAAIVADRILCVHGGISPELVSLEQIANIQRPSDVPDRGLLADLLWADPNPEIPWWNEHSVAVSHDFGIEAFRAVAAKAGFEMLVRAHQVVEHGYDFPFAGTREVVTVFSAPNYCGEFDNHGAVMLITGPAAGGGGPVTCAFMVVPRADYTDDGGAPASWRARARNL